VGDSIIKRIYTHKYIELLQTQIHTTINKRYFYRQQISTARLLYLSIKLKIKNPFWIFLNQIKSSHSSFQKSKIKNPCWIFL